jgi:hypothetical protein
LYAILINMNTTFDVLVIVLSCLLGLFLILSIIAISLTLKLIKSLRQIVAKGEHLVDSAEELGETFRQGAGMAGVLRLVLKVVKAVNKAKKE